MAGRWRPWARGLMAVLALVAVAALAVVAAGWSRRGGDPSVRVDRDLAYGSAGGRTLALDLYRPVLGASKGPRPAILMIHGGAWIKGDKREDRDLAEHFVRAGYAAVAINYRLAEDDASRYPAQLDDVRKAVRWVRKHAAEYDLDPDRLAAFGHSAGGHLAALLGTTEARDDPDPGLAGISSRVNCVVDCAGPTDFTDPPNPPIGPAIAWVVPNLFGKTRAEAPDAYREASPVARVDARSSPTLIVHGTEDVTVPIEQGRRFFVKLREAGVDARLVELEGEGHLFETPGAVRTWLAEMMAFLKAHLKP